MSTKIYGDNDTLTVVEIDPTQLPLYIQTVVYKDASKIYIDCNCHMKYYSTCKRRIDGTTLFVKIVRHMFQHFVRFYNNYNLKHFKLWKELRTVPRYYVEEMIQQSMD
jgi:hypothetical protein